MKTKPLKDFNRAEMAVVIDAMSRKMKYLKGFERDQFKADYDKVLEFGTEVELDGAGMKQIIRALNHKGSLSFAFHGPDKHKEERTIVFNLGTTVFNKFYQFQDKHHPLKKRKEAQAAVTDYASELEIIMIG